MDTSSDAGGGKIEQEAVERQLAAQQRRLTDKQDRLLRMQLSREIHSAQRERELKQLQERLSQERKPSFNHLEHTDKSRKHIAYVFVYGYIIVVTMILIGIPLYNWLALGKTEVLELEKTLAQVGALIGSPLGFVVGYYFKEDSRS